MAHDHHHHAPVPHSVRAFVVGVVLNTAFVVTELVFGWLADSTALIADAIHNLGDVAGLLLAWGAVVLARRPSSAQRTYGWRKSTVLASLANAVLILVSVGAIASEAIQRLADPPAVEGLTVMIVAGIGVAINTATAWMLHAGSGDDLNRRGAFLHMAGDAAISLGVVIAGGLLIATGAQWIDPVVSLLVAAIIAWTTWSLLRDSTNLILDAAPAGIDIAEVEATLLAPDSVTGCHDLHVWAMSTTENALTAHLTTTVAAAGEGSHGLLVELCDAIRQRYPIHHITIQFEPPGVDCPEGEPGAV